MFKYKLNPIKISYYKEAINNKNIKEFNQLVRSFVLVESGLINLWTISDYPTNIKELIQCLVYFMEKEYVKVSRRVYLRNSRFQKRKNQINFDRYFKPLFLADLDPITSITAYLQQLTNYIKEERELKSYSSTKRMLNAILKYGTTFTFTHMMYELGLKGFTMPMNYLTVKLGIAPYSIFLYTIRQVECNQCRNKEEQRSSSMIGTETRSLKGWRMAKSVMNSHMLEIARKQRNLYYSVGVCCYCCDPIDEDYQTIEL